ncbi:MAG: glycosyltransferase family 4 protein [Desulfobulbaceae bacterium]|nr:glycosyltransferase family 4 protein [Desulfobulbaceae bacterium]
MKILCATQFFPPSVGGMQVSNSLLLEGLAKAGVEIELLVFSDFPEPLLSEPLYKAKVILADLTQLRNQLTCAKTIIRHASAFRPDVILLLDDGVVRALGFWPFKRNLNFNIVSINSGSTLTRENKHFRGRVNSYFVKRGYGWLDLIFVADETAADLRASFPVFADRIKVMGRPIPDSFFGYGCPEHKDLISGSQLPILFSCSRADERKGLQLVLHALAILRDRRGQEVVRLIHAGNGPALAFWRQLATSLKLRNVDFVGKVPFSEIKKYYSSSYMCILPSIYVGESFGRTWVEAFACGKPVISTQIANLRYLVRDNENGIVILPDPLDICRGIEHALDMPAGDYATMSRRSYETALQYKQSVITSKLINELKDLNDTTASCS